MRIGEMIDQLESQGLTIDIFAYDRKPTISVFYDCIKKGNKFIEIHGKKRNSKDKLYPNMEEGKKDSYKKYEVSRVKFHRGTVLPASLIDICKNTTDGGSKTKQVEATNCSDEDIIAVAIASYNKVKEESQLEYTN